MQVAAHKSHAAKAWHDRCHRREAIRAKAVGERDKGESAVRLTGLNIGVAHSERNLHIVVGKQVDVLTCPDQFIPRQRLAAGGLVIYLELRSAEVQRKRSAHEIAALVWEIEPPDRVGVVHPDLYPVTDRRMIVPPEA